MRQGRCRRDGERSCCTLGSRRSSGGLRGGRLGCLPGFFLERKPLGGDLQIAPGVRDCFFLEPRPQVRPAFGLDELADRAVNKAAAGPPGCDPVEDSDRLIRQDDVDALTHRYTRFVYTDNVPDCGCLSSYLRRIPREAEQREEDGFERGLLQRIVHRRVEEHGYETDRPESAD